MLAMLIVLLFACPALAQDLARIDEGGQRILEIVRRIGYWLILLKCLSELIKAGLEGDTKSLGKIVMTYVLIYGALFFVPYALRLVEGIF